MQIIPLSAFRDNYIWLLHDGRQAVAVDPGVAAPVTAALRHAALQLAAILITHHHADHVGGVAELRDHWPAARVFGPQEVPAGLVSDPVREGDLLRLPGLNAAFTVLEVPGHTAGHVAYLCGDALFCGDTLFSAGCGRLLGGSAAQLHASLQRLAALPATTRVYCAHEYTLSNLAFAREVEADNPERERHAAMCEARRAGGQPTLPSSIGLERTINPFLRVDQAAIRASVADRQGEPVADDLACFSALRAWKDVF